MARMRGIKPTFFTDQTLSELKHSTKLTYIGLWTYCDDAGRGLNDARLIKGEIWPLDDKYGLTRIRNDIQQLADIGRICLYGPANKQVSHCFLHIIHWHHQNINRPKPSILPNCPHPNHHTYNQPKITDASLIDHTRVTDASVRKGSRKESEKEVEGETPAKPRYAASLVSLQKQTRPATDNVRRDYETVRPQCDTCNGSNWTMADNNTWQRCNHNTDEQHPF